MKFILLLSFFFLPISFLFSQQLIAKPELRNGDLLFVGAQKENLSGAINRVTQRNSNQSYDHIGLLEKDKDSVLFVLDASTKKGSARESLDSFCMRERTDSRVVAVYRLYANYQYAIPSAIIRAKELLGRPYNWSYVLNENSYYCSDFVERTFRQDTVFHLEPMTFVNPKTGKIDDYWIDFYKKQNMDVPEGKLGCNPNGLAASPKLYFVGFLNVDKEKY
ncbi:MAG TPA: YiiX/YebB-like N1pC/P60 family cysteine hydrolase [Arachidicoccus sp.]